MSNPETKSKPSPAISSADGEGLGQSPCSEFIKWAELRIKQCDEKWMAAKSTGDTRKAVNYGAKKKTFTEAIHWIKTHEEPV